mmetsp:Transcript_66363/g.130756  ORF Transcript_66363/g.130756 Transcript_66363/m.130756 type:complete len:263 (-) Transcript_66363:357-1145(-)|eukprot:CAMPEP_0172729808 /NCGR_PEP_ID=MMETSP1074-20121228/95949_1 /TAXON_ID=2916 /ORGANISM="Ceratium fusus, Strain PA161109" /LENGTH=262 /DNA_ID=CAMNT_0013557373 /DNA_START=45 /DNA_END=833 /DNA_ORIENTATION=-
MDDFIPNKSVEQIAKLTLWASAATSAAIYANDESNQAGHFFLYISAIVRTTFLVLMFLEWRHASAASSPSPVTQEKRISLYRESFATELLTSATRVPLLDQRMEMGAQLVLKLQFVYYIFCASVCLGTHINRWDYPHVFPISKENFLGHLWNAVDGLSSFFSFFFGVREAQKAEILGKFESHVIVEHVYSVVINGSMLALAVVSMCIDRGYGSPDFTWFCLSMACGTLEPIRFVLRKCMPSNDTSQREVQLREVAVFAGFRL